LNISRYCPFKKGSTETQERREEEKGGIGKNTPVQGDEKKDEICMIIMTMITPYIHAELKFT
jgi:hypothetical protein